jgi:tetratricopeptide (TPR) repeat protein
MLRAAETAALRAGLDDHLRAEVVAARASIAWETGRPDDAAAAYVEARALHESILGPDHPATGAIAASLGMVRCHAGDVDTCERELAETVARLDRTLGERHYETLRARTFFAAAQLERGRPAEAVPILERVLAIAADVLPADYGDLAVPEMYLGRAHVLLGNAEAAVGYLERAFERWRATYGLDDPNTSWSREHLARALWLRDTGDDRAHAITHAEAARDSYAKLGERDALAIVEAWLASVTR